MLTKKDLLEDLKVKIVIHAPTEADARKLLKWYESRGLTWHGGTPAKNKLNWAGYKKKTCYNHNDWISGSRWFRLLQSLQ